MWPHGMENCMPRSTKRMTRSTHIVKSTMRPQRRDPTDIEEARLLLAVSEAHAKLTCFVESSFSARRRRVTHAKTLSEYARLRRLLEGAQIRLNTYREKLVDREFHRM